MLPLAGDVLPALPPRLKAHLFQAFDIAVLWNKPASQATVHAEITDTTLPAVLAILNPAQDGYHDTATAEPMDDLTKTLELVQRHIDPENQGRRDEDSGARGRRGVLSWLGVVDGLAVFCPALGADDAGSHLVHHVGNRHAAADVYHDHGAAQPPQ